MHLKKKKTAAGQRQVLAKIQLGLIAAQDIGDDKLATVQAMTDLIENKARQLEHDAKNLEDEDENLVQAPPSSKDIATSKGSTKKPANFSDDKNEKTGPAKKRPKKQQKEDKPKADRSEILKDDVRDSTPSNRTGKSKTGDNNRGGTSTPNSSLNEKAAVTSSAGKRGGVSSAAQGKKGKGKKRSENAAGTDKTKHDKDTGHQKDDSDEIDLSTIEIDPDEPTYCLCDQVSYGEMIGCDNDLCPIEWFHFNCVQLSTKPKGKWYCPKCRGDKPTLMKPKAQFLKELEKYNKEREEKLMKQNS